MKRSVFWLLALLLWLSAGSSLAAEGKESGGKTDPYAHLEPFTVNMHEPNRYLQVTIALKGGAGTLQKVNDYKPMIRHQLILLLSSQSTDGLSTLQGKQKLMDDIKATVNKILQLDPKHGVEQVLFESFIIQ